MKQFRDMSKKKEKKKGREKKKDDSTVELDVKQYQETPAETKDMAVCWDGDTLILNILGQPGARRDAIGKVNGKGGESYIFLNNCSTYQAPEARV